MIINKSNNNNNNKKPSMLVSVEKSFFNKRKSFNNISKIIKKSFQKVNNKNNKY
jgi:hypothetical protein